ncbi:MAG: DUF1707 SHOCT-like domain-containing protein [Actinomadura sp.]
MSEPVPPDELRIGTRERDTTVAILADHFVAGRLEREEYDRRLGAALRARTRGDLRRLFRDLPPADQPFPYPSSDAGGRLPDRLRTELAADGLLILDEDLSGSITHRRYREPGKYVEYSRIPVVGTVAVTVGRLVVWAGGAKRVDVSFGQPLRAAVALSIDEPGQLLLKVDAQAANPDRSGFVEFRFRTPNAAIIRDLAGPPRCPRRIRA